MVRQLTYPEMKAVFTTFQAIEPEPKGELHHINAFIRPKGSSYVKDAPPRSRRAAFFVVLAGCVGARGVGW